MNKETCSAESKHQDEKNNDLFAIHLAECFLRLTMAIKIPEAVTSPGTVKTFIHLRDVCIETTSFLKSFCTFFRCFRDSTSSLRSLTNSACCSGERINLWSLSFFCC